MRLFNKLIAISALSISLLTTACSEDTNTQTKVVKKFPDVEAVAKQHAQEMAKYPIDGKKTQQKLFEIRAHEQDLRAEGLNDEADYYIQMFEKHLKEANPELANEIIKK